MNTEKERTERFMELLHKATIETGIAVGGCGHCQSPWTDNVEDETAISVTYRDVTYRPGYGSDLNWQSAYDRCLEEHRAEWAEAHRYLWCDKGIRKYGSLNTHEFGKLIIAGRISLEPGDPSSVREVSGS